MQINWFMLLDMMIFRLKKLKFLRIQLRLSKKLKRDPTIPMNLICRWLILTMKFFCLKLQLILKILILSLKIVDLPRKNPRAKIPILLIIFLRESMKKTKETLMKKMTECKKKVMKMMMRNQKMKMLWKAKKVIKKMRMWKSKTTEKTISQWTQMMTIYKN